MESYPIIVTDMNTVKRDCPMIQDPSGSVYRKSGSSWMDLLILSRMFVFQLSSFVT